MVATPSMVKSPAGKALFWEGGSLWIGLTNVRSDYHSHHAIQLGLALTGTAQFKTRRDPDWVHYSGVLIPPNPPPHIPAPCIAGRKTLVRTRIDDRTHGCRSTRR